MDNETKKMLEMLMNKLDTISENQKNMQENQKNMQENQKNMQENQKNMQESQKNMQESQKNMQEKQNSMEIRQDEIYSVVKAIEHSNTTHKAEIDNIIYKVAHTEGIINNIGNVITEGRSVK